MEASKIRQDNGFYVMVNGQVESCQMEGSDHLYCRYSFVYGKPDWTYTHGVEHGMSQIAVNRQGPDSVFAWNYPVDITLHSTNVHGWPQMVFSVYGVDWFGKPDVIKGYGSCFVPTVPGRHVRYVRLYAPISSSLCQQFTAWITCTPPEFFETNFIAQGKGREVTRVQSNGVIKVVLNVTTKNMSDWGYQTSVERVDPSENFDRQNLTQGPGDPFVRHDVKHRFTRLDEERDSVYDRHNSSSSNRKHRDRDDDFNKTSDSILSRRTRDSDKLRQSDSFEPGFARSRTEQVPRHSTHRNRKDKDR